MFVYLLTDTLSVNNNKHGLDCPCLLLLTDTVHACYCWRTILLTDIYMCVIFCKTLAQFTHQIWKYPVFHPSPSLQWTQTIRNVGFFMNNVWCFQLSWTNKHDSMSVIMAMQKIFTFLLRGVLFLSVLFIGIWGCFIR